MSVLAADRAAASWGHEADTERSVVARDMAHRVRAFLHSDAYDPHRYGGTGWTPAGPLVWEVFTSRASGDSWTRIHSDMRRSRRCPVGLDTFKRQMRAARIMIRETLGGWRSPYGPDPRPRASRPPRDHRRTRTRYHERRAKQGKPPSFHVWFWDTLAGVQHLMQPDGMTLCVFVNRPRMLPEDGTHYDVTEHAGTETDEQGQCVSCRRWRWRVNELLHNPQRF